MCKKQLRDGGSHPAVPIGTLLALRRKSQEFSVYVLLLLNWHYGTRNQEKSPLGGFGWDYRKERFKYEKRNTAGHNRDLFDDKSKNIYADMPPNREQAKRLAVKADL